MFKKFLLSFLILFSANVYADVVSLESNYVAGEADVLSKLNNDRTALANAVNNIEGVYTGSAQSSGQVKADTIGEENMADDANPRLRTAENVLCNDFVSSGLLPSTTSGTLVGAVPAGVAYPEGYRVEKTSSTAKTFTADMWTWVDIGITGSLTYTETAVGGGTPSEPSNTARLARVSTDSTEVVSVLDLRTTQCLNGPFNVLNDDTNEANLDNLFSYGAPVKDEGTGGLLEGFHINWNSHTQFTVKEGVARINGEYRYSDSTITVPQTSDDPANQVSGVDTSISADTRYNVFLVADLDNDPGISISYSSNSTPSGVTNHRKIGEISTDSDSLFTSDDITMVHAVRQREIIGGWITFDGSASTLSTDNSYNVSSIADNGTGDYTITWDKDFSDANYALVCSADTNGSDEPAICAGVSKAAGSVRIETINHGSTNTDGNPISVIAIGDRS